jgi:peptide/nickel transport system permease protein
MTPEATTARRPTTTDAAAAIEPAGTPTAGYEPAATPQQVVARRTILQQTLRDTFKRPTARAGLVWVLILATVGVFAPYLASSDPLLVKEKSGRVWSPLLHDLRPADVILTALYLAAVVLLVWRRFSVGRSVLILLLVGALAAVPAFTLFGVQAAPIYEKWRRAEAAGELEWVVRTIVPFSPNDRMNDQTGVDKLQPPSKRHWFGRSIFGEDVLSRMMHACRVALTIGFVSTTIAVLLGVTVGGIMGYFGGWTDILVMRAIEIMEAIPRLILLLIVAVFFGPWVRQHGISMIYLMMVVIGLIAWTADARFIRAEFLRLRKLDFVQAAKALGLPLRSIIFRHMLPNGIAPVLVNASFSVAGAILLESTLSFLGLGLLPEDPSWGQLLNQARSGGTGFNWWIATFPGLAIFLTVFSYVLIGEAMRDALDPKLRKSE